ncbi:MAG: ribonuclease HII, partial [Rhodospirillaceae bacterium]|nr:ribonuclease HII [Rhodospirillaceae bacterium]
MPDFSYENELGGRVAGIDEAGRGPWAGPVHAAAVIFAGGGPPLKMAARINDSKQLSASQREALYPELFDVAKIGIGTASVD